MNVRETLFTELKKGVPLVGNRVYAGHVAKNNVETPYIVFFIVSKQTDNTHGGESGLYLYRIQVSCYAYKYEDVASVAEEVQETLRNIEGVDDVSATFDAAEQDLFEEDTGLYHIPVDFMIHTNIY